MNEISTWRIRRIAPTEHTQPEYAHMSEPEEVSLLAYWNILVKNRRIILGIFLVTFAVGSYFALSATTLYTATTTIKIEPQKPQVTGGIGEFLPDEFRSQEYDYHQTQFSLLRSRPLAARVITDLGLESKKAFTDAAIVSPNPLVRISSWISSVLGFFTSYLKPLFRSSPATNDAQGVDSLATSGKGVLELTVKPSLIDQYLNFIQIVPQKNTRLASIQVTTPNPTLSQALANAHIQTFMRMSLESRFGLTQEAREFLEQKKNELRQKLEKSEAELNKFRRQHNVLSVDKGENIVVDRLVDLNKQLTGVRAQRIDAESLNRTVENRNYQDLAEIMRQGLVQQLNSNVANLEAEKARVATIFKPDHPRIQELNQQIAAARQAFNNEIASVVRGIKSNYAAAIAKERALESEVSKQQQDALNLRELGVQFTVLQEDVNANRSLYESVLKRLSETNVSNDLAISNMQIAERAAKPLGPSGPNVPLFLLASMLSGLFFGAGLTFLRELLYSTVDTPDTVWRAIGVGTLGVVPHVKFLGEQAHTNGSKLAEMKRGRSLLLPTNSVAPGKELIINQSSLSVITESYRNIRTSLLLTQAEKPPQVIILTSPSPREGKTTTSLNLAIALAQDGRSVLMIDGDMRKGLCHDRLGLRNHRGLSNVLTGGLSLEEGVQQTKVKGLSLLSRGITPPNPSELLGSRKMTEIMNELRQRFEFILIDSPPVIGISDAAILSVIADGVLLVFNGETTSTAYAQKAVERLDMVRARLLGVVLNAVNLDDPNYSYYRSYSAYYEIPNGTGLASEAQQKASEDAETSVAKLGTVVQSDTSGTSIEELDESDPGPAENNSQVHNIAGDGQGSSTHEADTHKKANFELHSAARKKERGGATKVQSVDLVPRWFLERLIDIFAESIGPVAPLVVRDHIASLGESPNAFPKTRVGELVKLIAPEIWHEDLRSQFQSRITEEIRTFENI